MDLCVVTRYYDGWGLRVELGPIAGEDRGCSGFDKGLNLDKSNRIVTVETWFMRHWK